MIPLRYWYIYIDGFVDRNKTETPYENELLFFAQSDWDNGKSGYNTTVDDRYQYGEFKGRRFLVLHDKERTPYTVGQRKPHH
jgi:hypothetical protein